MRSFNALPLPQTPEHRPRSDYDGSTSPRKRARCMTTTHAPPLPPPRLLPPPPDDVAELRRRITARGASLDGFEQCPYAQTSGAMLLATTVAADDVDPITAARDVLWLMRAGNQHWFNCALRTAVCEPGRYMGLLRGLLSSTQARSFWPADQLAATLPSSSSKTKTTKKAKGNDATRTLLRVLRAQSSAARKRAAVWGPFSAHFQVDEEGIHSEEEEEDKEEVYCGACNNDDHSPALLMLDALLHGNLAAARLVAETFTPSAWRITGQWSVGGGGGKEEEEEHGEENQTFVPASAIRLSATIVARATTRVAAASRVDLNDQVRQCLRAAQQSLVPELVEEDEQSGGGGG